MNEERNVALAFSGDVDTNASGIADAKPQVFFLGDSHTVSIMAAAKDMDLGALPFGLFASRFEKVKRETGAVIAGVTMKAAADMLTLASVDDILVSLVGGNQFNAIGLMQHPTPFNFFAPDSDNSDILPGEQLIPLAVVENMFTRYVGQSRNNFLVGAKDYFKGRLFHAVPPPPKSDNDFIKAHAETMFRDRGIETFGVTRPTVRLKLWQAQIRAMRRLYEPMGIGLLMPLSQSTDADGYLLPDYYGPDATHANKRYGKLVIDQVAALLASTNERGAIA